MFLPPHNHTPISVIILFILISAVIAFNINVLLRQNLNEFLNTFLTFLAERSTDQMERGREKEKGREDLAQTTTAACPIGHCIYPAL